MLRMTFRGCIAPLNNLLDKGIQMKKLFSFNILFVLILACTCFLAETCEEMFDDDDDDNDGPPPRTVPVDSDVL